MKVNFMLIGAMKSGTTTMAKILSKHPEISFCKKKEPHFFSDTTDWKNEIEEYHKLFKAEKGKIYGEASTAYTSYPKNNLKIWDDIHSYNSKMKFIYIIRNPVDRVVSHYMQRYQKGRIKLSIEESIKNIPDLINRTRYFMQINPYIQKFGKEQILLIDFDDFINSREKVMKEVAGFLNIKYELFTNFNFTHSNPSINGKKLHYRFDKIIKVLTPVLSKTPEIVKDTIRKVITNPKRIFKEKPSLSTEYRELIINLTKLDIIEIQKLMNKDLSKWMKV